LSVTSGLSEGIVLLRWGYEVVPVSQTRIRAYVLGRPPFDSALVTFAMSGSGSAS